MTTINAFQSTNDHTRMSMARLVAGGVVSVTATAQPTLRSLLLSPLAPTAPIKTKLYAKASEFSCYGFDEVVQPCLPCGVCFHTYVFGHLPFLRR